MEETFDSPSQKEEKKIPKNCHLRLCNGEIFYIREVRCSMQSHNFY